jgi:hypothetical protein
MNKNLIAVALALMAAISCDRTRSSTGWDYMPDMYYSNAFESYTPNPNFDDQLTMRTPVEGTVPREMVPFPWGKSDEDRIAAGKALVNPLEASGENLKEGSRRIEPSASPVTVRRETAREPSIPASGTPIPRPA